VAIIAGRVGERSTATRSEYSCAFSSEHQVVIARDTLDPGEARSIATGNARFALYVEESCLILLCRFGDGGWCAFGVPWFECAGPMLNRRAAAAPDPEAVRLVVRLVAGGALAAVRYCTFTPDFTRTLNDTLLEFLGRTWPGLEEYLAWVRGTCGRKPSLAWMATHALAVCEDPWPEGQAPAEVLILNDEEDYW